MPTSGFWVRVADLVVRHPVAILSVCLVALLPLAVVGARTRVELQPARRPRPRPPSVIGAEVDPALLRRRRAQPGRGPGRQPGAGLPLAARAGRPSRRSAGGSRAIDHVAEVRSLTQPLGKPLGRPDRQGLLRPVRRPVPLHAAAESRYVSVKPPTRPTPTTSRGSTSSSRPTPSPRPASRPSSRSARSSRPPRRPASRWKGRRAIGLAGLDLGGQRPPHG